MEHQHARRRSHGGARPPDIRRASSVWLIPIPSAPGSFVDAGAQPAMKGVLPPRQRRGGVEPLAVLLAMLALLVGSSLIGVSCGPPVSRLVSTQRAQRALKHPVAAPFLLQSSTRELQRSAKFLAQPLSRSSTAAVAVAAAAAVGATNATSTVEPWATAGVDLPDCRPSGPHRRTFTPQELALHEARLEAWRSGAAQGVAMCLVVKGACWGAGWEVMGEWLAVSKLARSAQLVAGEARSR
mgnify:CR=1 FL=1